MEPEGALTENPSLSMQNVEIIDVLSNEESSIDDATIREESARKDASEESDEDGEDDEIWESESLYADALEGLGDEQLSAGGETSQRDRMRWQSLTLSVGLEPGACTLEEAIAYRQEARMIGTVAQFVGNTVGTGAITAKKLCTAFGIRPPAFLEGAKDRAYDLLLYLGVTRELSKRNKLTQYNTMEDAMDLLRKSNNIIVITGAGISTSLGIPDFRSKETGLYSKIELHGLSDPQEVFDIGVFREEPGIFYEIAKDILPSTDKFSPTHAFIHLLQERNKLLTNYTQNIDNLEVKAGIREDKLIQCHGSFAFASCVKCGYRVPGEAIFEDLKAGRVARCPDCGSNKRKRGASQNKGKNKRSSGGDSDDDEEYDIPEPGVMKPDITFFGEELPHLFHDRLTKHDRDLVDLVIVIGTSLKVAPVSEVIGYLPSNVPQMYISRTPVNHINFDLDFLGDCDVVVAELCRRLNWDLEHEMIPKDQKIDVQLQDGFASRYTFKVIE
ncbi:hypothetical protein FGG08_000884 [Glutinoglossum americanum]|uniref:Deacetylase sirtuin-type domain-containing protein n=1 Tax=Glutinoglossum americanum TaxID=1670608 RepID=A0A9P8IHK1_9PEZI|nr:hypothetical protein FGG08_000884 [Glutinoglossum americanum]